MEYAGASSTGVPIVPGAHIIECVLKVYVAHYHTRIGPDSSYQRFKNLEINLVLLIPRHELSTNI